MLKNLGKPLIHLGLVLIVLGFIFIWSGSFSGADTQVVRVAVVTDADQLSLSISSPFKILALNTNEELYSGRRLWRGKVLPTETGIQINKLDFKIYGLRIQPSRSPAIKINRRKFRGAIDIIRQADNKLLVINHIDVEEYIKGVLYHEVSPRWPMAALKAQAIVARTFALYQAKINLKKDYDLVSTVYSQVYGGRTSERGRTSKAVKLTRDQVLTFKNKIFPTFYHATCAGYTENSSALWKISLAPLRGRECQFCQRSPHFNWQKKISLAEIEQALRNADFKVGTIESIEMLDKNVSGRNTELAIASDYGEIKILANPFRLAIGPNLIKSTNFTVQLKKRQAIFTGTGWGHGVGMCQWGAFFMSKKRFNVEQILGYYYPEAKIKLIEEIKDAQGNFKSF
ncbi:SpoIID/LytB domain-containing protein [Candidatus Omnitrophota bacterium]